MYFIHLMRGCTNPEVLGPFVSEQARLDEVRRLIERGTVRMHQDAVSKLFIDTAAGQVEASAFTPAELPNRPTFTVHIAGPERHEGHKHYTYGLYAANADDAIEAVVAKFTRDMETTDIEVIGCVPGLPPDKAGYTWNDLR